MTRILKMQPPTIRHRKKPRMLKFLALTLIITSSTVLAEEAKPGAGVGGVDVRVLKAYDTNNDNELSKEELAAIKDESHLKIVKLVDTNKDGAISPEEIAAGRGAPKEGQGK